MICYKHWKIFWQLLNVPLFENILQLYSIKMYENDNENLSTGYRKRIVPVFITKKKKLEKLCAKYWLYPKT